MNLIRIALLAMAVLTANSGGDALAGNVDPPIGTAPPPLEDVSPDDDEARPEWADPNASDPTIGVDDDPTPFDPSDMNQ